MRTEQERYIENAETVKKICEILFPYHQLFGMGSGWTFASKTSRIPTPLHVVMTRLNDIDIDDSTMQHLAKLYELPFISKREE